MQHGLAAFAALRRILPLPVKPWMVRRFRILSDALQPFGTGDGGMSATVGSGTERRIWRLPARDGNSPFIPAIAVRAPSAARACRQAQARPPA